MLFNCNSKSKSESILVMFGIAERNDGACKDWSF